MTKFAFEVKDDFFPMTFEGTIEEDTKQDAHDELAETYAHELDTTIDALTITLKEIK